MHINTANIDLYFRQTDQVSHRVAQGLEKTDVAREMVNMIVAEKGVKIAVRTIQAQDEMLGSLLDIKA